MAFTRSENDQIPGSIAIQTNGEIMVAGWQEYNFFAARFDPLNGSLDTTFGVNGVTASTGVSIVSVSTTDGVDVVIQPDGKIVMTGKRTGGDFALARFLGDSSPTLVMAAAIGATGGGSIQPDGATQSPPGASNGQPALSFEANQAQADSRVDFLSRGAVYSSFRTPTKLLLSRKQGKGSNVVGIKRVGANPASRAVVLEKLSGMSNHFNGNDPLIGTPVTPE